MSDEQWLRDGLADAVPEPPRVPDRARSAESLARRRRRTTAVVALGAAGAVAAVAVFTATLGSDPDSAGPATEPTASESPAAVPACPPAPRPGKTDPLDQPDPDAPDAVPDGATSARLCQGPGTSFDIPLDALATDVDDLAATVNGLESTGEPEVCTMDLGPGYRIAFGYDDGSQFVVSGELYGCRTVVVGSGYRAGSQPPWDTFIDLLRAQRDATEPPETTTRQVDLSCPDGTGGRTSPVARAHEITEAALCVTDAAAGDVSGVAIPDDDLAVLVEDMRDAEPSDANEFRSCPATPERLSYMIVAGTAWDDHLVLPSSCWGYSLPGGLLWAPGDEARQILDRLAGEVR